MTSAAADTLAFTGQILDCDGHLYMEPDVMADIVGTAGSSWIIDYLRRYFGSDADLRARARARAEPWEVKGISALGSYDPRDRVAALDTMGIHRQLLFPNTVLRELRIDSTAARDACRKYNDYVVDWTRRADDRARAVCQVNMADREWALGELRRVIGMGASGVLLPCAEPPAGTSPAAPVWDEFWRLLEESETPAFIHIGAGGLASAEDDDPNAAAAAVGRRTRAPSRLPGTAGSRGAVRTLLHRRRASRGRGVPHLPAHGWCVRAVPAPALRCRRVRRSVARSAV